MKNGKHPISQQPKIKKIKPDRKTNQTISFKQEKQSKHETIYHLAKFTNTSCSIVHE